VTGTGSLIRVKSREADKIIMLPKQGSHDTISAVGNRPNANTCPLADILIQSCIAIVASTIKKDGKLHSNRELGIIGLVIKDRVITDLIEDIIKYIRINAELHPE
jgi:hypothetical protein